jgi:hypothetical protein
MHIGVSDVATPHPAESISRDAPDDATIAGVPEASDSKVERLNVSLSPKLSVQNELRRIDAMYSRFVM